MKYGQLLACFKVAETTHSLCIVRELAEIEAMDDQPLHNELDCPLLTMTNELHVVQTASVLTAVSMKALKCKTLGRIRTRRLWMYVLHHAQSTSQLTPHHCSSICRVSAKLHTSTHAQPVSIAICKVRCYFCQQLSRLLHAGCESN